MYGWTSDSVCAFLCLMMVHTGFLHILYVWVWAMMHCKCKTFLGGKFYTSLWRYMFKLLHWYTFFAAPLLMIHFIAMQIECTFQMVFVFQIILGILVQKMQICMLKLKRIKNLHSFWPKWIKSQTKQKILLIHCILHILVSQHELDSNDSTYNWTDIGDGNNYKLKMI